MAWGENWAAFINMMGGGFGNTMGVMKDGFGGMMATMGDDFGGNMSAMGCGYDDNMGDMRGSFGGGGGIDESSRDNSNKEANVHNMTNDRRENES